MLSNLDAIYAATCIILFVIIHSIAVINSSSLIIPSAHHPAVLLIQGCTSEIDVLSVVSGNDIVIIPSFTKYSSPEIKLSLSILSSDHHFALLFTQTGIIVSSVTSSKNVSTGCDWASCTIPDDITSIALGILFSDDHFFMFHDSSIRSDFAIDFAKVKSNFNTNFVTSICKSSKFASENILFGSCMVTCGDFKGS